MANVTVFQGRQCTRVRRAVIPAASPSPKANTSPSVSTTQPAAGPTTASSRTSSSSTSTPANAIAPSLPGVGNPATVVLPLPPLLAPPASSSPRPPQVTSTLATVSAATQQPPAAVPFPPQAVTTTAVPKVPEPQPQPPASPQSPPPNQIPTQRETGNVQQSQQPQQSVGFPSPKPFTQVPVEASQARSGTNVGNGSNASETAANGQQNGRPSQVPPAQQTSQVGQLVPPLSQAQGTEVRTTQVARQTLVPSLVTSNGVTRTTLVLPSSTAKGRTTESPRSSTSRTLSASTSTRSAGVGAGTSVGVKSARSNNVPIVAGVVSAFVVIIAICALIFFRARRKRSNTPTEIASRYRDSSSTNGRNVRTFFGSRFSRGNNDFFRSSSRGTPILERGPDALPYMAEPETYRRRSLSEPATSRSIQQTPVMASQPVLPAMGAIGASPLVSLDSANAHRRSVSSLSGMAYPILTDNNNPFLDPEPNALLRIVNPELSGSGSSATSSPQTLSKTSPAVGASPLSNATSVAGVSPPLRQAAVASPPRSLHQRTPSILQDPFRDTETILEDPFADPVAPLSTSNLAKNSRMNHQRNKSSLATSASQYSDSSPEKNGDVHRQLMAGIPTIMTTAPSSIASSHMRQLSGGSGFVSTNGSPTPTQPSRFEGLGISNLLPRTSRVAAKPSLLPTSALQDPNLLQPSLASGTNRRVSHHRLSSTSSASDLSLSFPASWGSPGPTRPASVATEGGPSLAAALAAANSGSTVQKPRDSSASDPFDLDDPNLLSYRISTLTRTATQRTRKPDASES